MSNETVKTMAPRTWLTEGREKLGMDRQEFGNLCGCSEMLIRWLEEGVTITHPLIAAVIVRVIGGTVAQYNELVHPDRKAKVVPKVKMPGCRDAWKKPKECVECKRVFTPSNRNQIFCNMHCAGRHNQNIRRARVTEELMQEGICQPERA